MTERINESDNILHHHKIAMWETASIWASVSVYVCAAAEHTYSDNSTDYKAITVYSKFIYIIFSVEFSGAHRMLSTSEDRLRPNFAIIILFFFI